MTCRICLEDCPPSPDVCNCKGTHGHVHIECVQKWIDISGKTTCGLCNYEYNIVNLKSVAICHVYLISLTAWCFGCFLSLISAYNVYHETTTHSDIIVTVFTMTMMCCLQSALWYVLCQLQVVSAIFCSVSWYLLFVCVSIYLQNSGVGFYFIELWLAYCSNSMVTFLELMFHVCIWQRRGQV